MNKNLTEIILVSDRSGSMQSCREEAENGINHFIKEQQNLPGEARLTFVEFDDKYEVLYDGDNIKSVAKYDLKPRGWTALYDAVGKAMTTVGQRLANTPEENRPGLVVCVISTDGAENSSKEYNRQRICDMIKEQREKYSWQFQFLGANIDANAVGGAMGLDNNVKVASEKLCRAYTASSGKVKMMRAMSASGASMGQIGCANVYTDSEKEDLA